MFTGLVQDVGRISRLTIEGTEAEISVTTILSPLEIGESIAINGACLSVTRLERGGFTAFASPETLAVTGMGTAVPGMGVNLERALRVGDPVGGHYVAGHVDTTIRLQSRTRSREAERWRLTMPADGSLKAQLAHKGSVALNGVSLTINEVSSDWFEVMVIPLTLEHTTFGDLHVGTMLNLETDVLAKYVAGQLEQGTAAGGTVNVDLLKRTGFMR
jgi:riboflavin synthase